MAYAVENAMYQWQEVSSASATRPSPSARSSSARPRSCSTSCRRRLGSTFVLDELADLLRRRTPTGPPSSRPVRAGGDAASVVDAAFARYARESSNFAGGRRARSTRRA